MWGICPSRVDLATARIEKIWPLSSFYEVTSLNGPHVTSSQTKGDNRLLHPYKRIDSYLKKAERHNSQSSVVITTNFSLTVTVHNFLSFVSLNIFCTSLSISLTVLPTFYKNSLGKLPTAFLLSVSVKFSKPSFLIV